LITTALMNPLPMSSPTVERAREISAISARFVWWKVSKQYRTGQRKVKD
jgi:hypothetical protein